MTRTIVLMTMQKYAAEIAMMAMRRPCAALLANVDGQDNY